MITRQTVVDQVELTRHGVLNVRLGLLMVEEGKEIDCKWHRTSVPIDGDVAQQMGFVNEHLELMGVQKVSDEDVARIASYFQAYLAAHATDAPGGADVSEPPIGTEE